MKSGVVLCFAFCVTRPVENEGFINPTNLLHIIFIRLLRDHFLTNEVLFHGRLCNAYLVFVDTSLACLARSPVAFLFT